MSDGTLVGSRAECIRATGGRAGRRFAVPTLVAALAVAQPAGGQGPPVLDGIWRSDGYGYAVRVAGDSLRMFELTEVSCIPSVGAHRTGADGRSTVFTFDEAPETFEMVAGGATADEARLQADGTASHMVLHRVPSLPERCARPEAADPLTTFDVFWETYREQYPFFALRHVDWRAVRARVRPQVAHASPQQLFEALRGMIEPLHDAHTYIAGSRQAWRYAGGRPDPDPIGRAGRERVFGLIAERLRGPRRVWGSGRILFGMLPHRIAYLRLTSFTRYVPGGGYAADRRLLDAVLDTVFASAGGWGGLVIDVRINGGGDDPLGLAIAERLATGPYVAYTKVARRDPDDPRQMTPGQPSVVRPSVRPGWRGPVAELTSRYSVSAAETFTQALIGRRPAVPRIGESTQGVFSDVLDRRLPNGWQFGLPNELYLTAGGTTFDGSGVPPTDTVPTFAAADLAAGRDPGLDRAIAWLDRAAGDGAAAGGAAARAVAAAGAAAAAPGPAASGQAAPPVAPGPERRPRR